MTDVAIIGAGVIGCSIALELARRDVSTTVIDRHGAVGHGSTSASCGIVRRYYSTPTMTAMAQEGALVWADWQSYLGTDDASELARFERPGMLFIPPKIDESVQRTLAHMRELGVDAELLSPEEVARRFPFLETASQSPIRSPHDDDFFRATGRSIEGAVFEADAGYVVSPLLATQNLHAAAQVAGVGFRLGCGVVRVQVEAGNRFQLELSDGTALDAAVLVNVAGPHSGVVNRMVGVSLPIETRPLRREVAAIRNPRFTEPGEPPVPVVGDVDSGVYWRPESGGRDLLVGSLDPQCDVLEWVADPDDWNTNCTEAGYERQVMRTMKRFPEVDLDKRRGIAGLYDVTLCDWHPVLDRTDLPGYYVAMGTSGSSFKTAPVIGAVMAELIAACEAGHDHDAVPVRIQLPRTGFEVDVGFFSRLREGRMSSGTVLG
ncbi:MAG: FAD-dependent oxidoreductase [Planctomycetes bacterium]|jgi:sarcosine oxidase subunit beta|nr:FAD-dependent oxidoreductase [Planctomycetota bacterium]MDP6423901.1 FAD-dependent oxidoreductase [Planctomycetota bacterium]